MASGKSSLDSNLSGGEGSHGYLGFPSDKSIQSSNVNPLEYEQMKQQQQYGIDPMIEMNNLRRQTEYYRTKAIALRNDLEMILRDKRRLECTIDNFKKDDIDVHALFEQYANCRTELEKLSKEMEICKKLRDKFADDCKAVSHEKNALHKQLARALYQLEEKQTQFLQEKKSIVSTNETLEEELKLIISEKDTVLKEIQRLSDECTHANSQLKIIESDNKNLKCENNCLKQEIKKTARKYESLEEQLKMIKSRPEFKSLSSDSWSKDLSETKDNYSDVTEHYEHEIQEATHEIGNLKQALDKAMGEISKAAQDIDIAKKQRDWAIAECDKITHQRDSIQVLCDKLRVERSTAISSFLAAIRDSENIKKQKDEACKEIEQLKEYLGSQMSSPNPCDMRWNYHGYELELMQKCNTEIINVDIGQMATGDCDLGLALDDGRSDPETSQNGSIIVLAVYKDSIFDNKLQKDDIILQVNNLDCKNASKKIVLEQIRSSPTCSMIVKRQKSLRRYIAQIDLSDNRNHGLSLDSGIFISNISAGSLAADDKILDVGDRILSINNRSMEGVKNWNEAMTYLDDTRLDTLTIVGLKQMVSQSGKIRAAATQTDEYLSVDRSIDWEGNRHFVPTTYPYLESPSSYTSTTPTPPKLSIFADMFQKIRGIKPNSKSNNDTDAAIAELDLVLKDDLPSNIPTKDNSGVIKRVKKKNKELSTKESSKSMGTWPRANTIAHDSNTGTIVQHKHKERAKLFEFTEQFSVKPSQVESRNEYFHSTSSNMPQAPSHSVNKSNRNSNPIPSYQFMIPSPPSISNRHSAAVSTLPRHQKLPDMNYNHHHDRYRLSLNLTPTGDHNIYSPNKNLAMNLIKSPTQSTSSNQQTSLDFIQPKSQNSIDSFMSSISPPPLEFTSKLPPKDPIDYISQRKINKSAAKYPSDSESLGPDVINSGDLGGNFVLPYNRVYSPKSGGLYSQYAPIYPTSHQHTVRLSSPSTLPSSQSNENNLGSTFSEKVGFETYTPRYTHQHGASVDYTMDGNRMLLAKDRKEILSSFASGNIRYEGGTFPRPKEHQRLRIPSNPSVTSKGSGVKNSTGSIEHHGSERGSPMPSFQVEVLSHGSNANQRNSMPDYAAGQKPNPGDLRRVTIDKSVEPLGITIRCNNNGGGIFVSTVTENSLASQVGLQIGDQLLEVCGINMRAATYEGASRVLGQCGNPITMLVQYSPEKYDGEIEQNSDDQSVSHSGSPTPRNSPRPARSLYMNSSSKQVPVSSTQQTTTKASKIPLQIQKVNSDSSTKTDLSSVFSNRNSVSSIEEPRVLYIETNKSSNLGIRLVGGNAFGIFVENVEKDTLADKAGMRVGDQILEFNGSDLTRAIAEHAAYELAKPANDKVTVIVQNNLEKYNQIKDKPGGDSFYIRAGFDRTAELGELELRFTKDEVLYVDNTILSRGQWRAWKLDETGHGVICGIIPSQLKVEEELRLHGDISDNDATARRGSTSARRSFFRRKKHPRSSSRDSKELASFSNTKLSWHSDSGMLTDETVQSYQRVERIYYPFLRPVLVLGPLADWVVSKLTNDFPQQFKGCLAKTKNYDIEAVENLIKSNSIVDYRRLGNNFEVTPVKSIREVAEKNRHCVLDISLSGVERLQRLNIFPIVLLLRFKSAKQIKEIKDSRYASDKISAKAAKEMYEHSLNLLADYKHLISAVIPAGVNITHICTQVKDGVEKEQKKIIWVPSSVT